MQRNINQPHAPATKTNQCSQTGFERGLLLRRQRGIFSFADAPASDCPTGGKQPTAGAAGQSSPTLRAGRRQSRALAPGKAGDASRQPQPVCGYRLPEATASSWCAAHCRCQNFWKRLPQFLKGRPTLRATCRRLHMANLGSTLCRLPLKRLCNRPDFLQ